MGRSTAWNGASSRIAAWRDRQPASWLWAINRFPERSTRPWVSRAVNTELGGTIIGNYSQRGERPTCGPIVHRDFRRWVRASVRISLRSLFVVLHSLSEDHASAQMHSMTHSSLDESPPITHNVGTVCTESLK